MGAVIRICCCYFVLVFPLLGSICLVNRFEPLSDQSFLFEMAW